MEEIRQEAKREAGLLPNASGDLKVPQNWRPESGQLCSSNFLPISF